MPRIQMRDVFVDIKPVSAQANERLGYPTKNPKVYWNGLLKKVETMAISFLIHSVGAVPQ
jgi:hypothetical protein